MRRNLLFVTYQNEYFDDGLSYAIELARTLDKDLSVLLVQEKKGLMEKFTDLMAASAFAEACEPDAAIQIMDEGKPSPVMDSEKSARTLRKCAIGGVKAAISKSDKELLPAVRDAVKQFNIEMVLLGPTVTGNQRLSARELNKLVKSATTPVVTIAKPATAA